MTTLTLPPDTAPSISASSQQLLDLRDQMRATIEAGEVAIGQIKSMCGEEPVGPAYELLRRFNFGVGMWREAESLVAQLYRAKNKAGRSE